MATLKHNTDFETYYPDCVSRFILSVDHGKFSLDLLCYPLYAVVPVILLLV